ncbi:diacylglycerol kinase family protein [Candidatus Parcubacteria bacterium]|nr:MAG: diacylglycerol kinase family protein [Candidatus Parcubacteria bacterium]
MTGLKIFLRSVSYALNGIKTAFLEQQNLKIEFFLAVVAILLGLVLKIGILDFAIVLILIAGVLVLELLNTAFEKILDALSPRIHIYVKTAKDVFAGAVFIASVASFIIGILIFLPYLLKL